MNIRNVKEILSAEVVCCQHLLEKEVHTGCGSDLMSDVLAFAKDRGVLLTGLNNPQVVRTAEVMDMVCIVYVRGKKPNPDVLDLAEQTGLVVMATNHTMFVACGLLYAEGLRGGPKRG